MTRFKSPYITGEGHRSAHYEHPKGRPHLLARDPYLLFAKTNNCSSKQRFSEKHAWDNQVHDPVPFRGSTHLYHEPRGPCCQKSERIQQPTPSARESATQDQKTKLRTRGFLQPKHALPREPSPRKKNDEQFTRKETTKHAVLLVVRQGSPYPGKKKEPSKVAKTKLHLHPKDVLGRVPAQKRPLASVALQQVMCQRHRPAGDVCTLSFHYPPALGKKNKKEKIFGENDEYVRGENNLVTHPGAYEHETTYVLRKLPEMMSKR